MTDSMEVASDDNAEDTSVGDLVFADDVLVAGEDLDLNTPSTNGANTVVQRTLVNAGADQVN